MSADLPESNIPLAEISQGPSAFEQFLDRNQKNLIALAILVALGTAGYVVYSGIQESHETTAGTALTKAEDLASLQAVINDHAETRAARSAMVLLADKQWSEGQQDAAVETLRKFIDSHPNHPAIGSARASLGAKLMAQGKSGDATAVFQEIADDPKERFIAPFALIALGDIAKAGGDTAKAETHYSRVSTEFSASSFAQTASQRVASLKAKSPTEVEPPPAPKPEEKPTDAGSATPPSAPTQLPGGISVTPVDPDAPATDIESAPEPAPTPPTAPAQESPPATGSEAQPESTPAPPQP